MDIFFCKLPPKGLVRVSGEDAEDYLQSQWTLNLRELKTGGIQYGLRLSTRGKVLADAYFLRLGDEEFLLISRECSGENLIELLEENIVADEVEFTNESGKWELHTYWNKKTNVEWKLPDIDIPLKNSYSCHGAGYLFEDFRVGAQTISLLLPNGTKNSWKDIADEVSSTELSIHRVKNCMASVPSEIGPDELPQEGRLETDAVSFTKGCYLGQEVMARIHAMGRVRRLIYPVTWSGSEIPSLPSTLFSGEKKVGVLKSLYPRKSMQSIGIAIIHENGVDFLKQKGLTIDGKNNGHITAL